MRRACRAVRPRRKRASETESPPVQRRCRRRCTNRIHTRTHRGTDGYAAATRPPPKCTCTHTDMCVRLCACIDDMCIASHSWRCLRMAVRATCACHVLSGGAGTQGSGLGRCPCAGSLPWPKGAAA